MSAPVILGAHEKRPADVYLPPGVSARPPGRGWRLMDYSWDDHTGEARLCYRRYHWSRSHRRWVGTKEQIVVEAQQPAGRFHAGWKLRPEIDREALLTRRDEEVIRGRKLSRLRAAEATIMAQPADPQAPLVDAQAFAINLTNMPDAEAARAFAGLLPEEQDAVMEVLRGPEASHPA